MIDLDARLAAGPLRVRSLWSGDNGASLERATLRRRRALLVIDAVVASTCLALIVVFAARTQLPPAFPLPSTAAAMTAKTFLDGSTAELVGIGSRLNVEVETARQVVTTLTGGARFRVVPNRQRTFQVQAGEVRVRVLGTVFSVVQLPSNQTQVFVEQGRVEVDWMGGSTILRSGQGGAFPPVEMPPAEAEPPTSDEMGSSAEAEAAASDDMQPTARDSMRSTQSDDLRRAKPGVASRDDSADVLQAADAARLSGQLDKALGFLRDLYERHATDRAAPVAAFTAGRILLDDMKRPVEAATAFHRARSLWPAGPLAEDALAREAEAWERACRLDRSRALATRYLALYPNGRHVDALRALLPP